jgi:hypothetical protein
MYGINFDIKMMDNILYEVDSNDIPRLFPQPVLSSLCKLVDRLCGLVVRVLCYRSGGPGSIPGTNRKKAVGLERGPLSLVSKTEELLDGNVAAPV